MPSVEERLRYWRERALNAETKALTLETVLMLAPADQRQWHLSRTLHEIGYFNRGDLCTSFSISVPQASKDIGRWMQENPGRARYNTSSKRYEKIDTGEMFDLFSWVKK